MYETLDDLPYVCRINLPEAAQRVYRDAFNRAWKQAPQEKMRFQLAQTQAWMEVRDRFERDRETGRWIPKAAPLEPRVAELSAMKHAAR
ncbi:MAG TPA: ChaB family protein [Thermoanaerobaculia bacterium]|jgi:cation transport regulator ChaB